jgi:hypothetical protein
LIEQLFSSTFEIEDIIVSEPNLTAPEALIEISVSEEGKNLKIDLHHAKLSEYGTSIENVKFDGSFNQLNVLEESQIAIFNGSFLKKLHKFPEISASVKKSSHDQYLAQIKGNMDEVELANSDNLIGLLPRGNFLIDLELDRAISKVTSISKINFHSLIPVDISGTVEMGFSSELLTKLKCALADCELSDFDFAYMINFDDEWVSGSANCAKSFCGLAELDHLVRTSNTVNIFKILNQTNILNPLLSIYLYGAISSGQKINGGHELKFQF